MGPRSYTNMPCKAKVSYNGVKDRKFTPKSNYRYKLVWLREKETLKEKKKKALPPSRSLRKTEAESRQQRITSNNKSTNGERAESWRETPICSKADGDN